MALDGLAGAFDARRLDYVGIERALNQPFHSSGFFRNARGFVVEDGDKLSSDALAFGLGIDDSRQLLQKALTCVHGDDFQAEVVAHILLDTLKFIFAQDAVVDEDAGELAADGSVHQHRRDR